MKRALACAAAVAATLAAGTAFADPAFTANTPQVGGGLQYGIFMGDDEGDPPNPYNLGLNVRGGYTLDMGLYVGGVVDYFFGESKEVGVAGFNTEVSMNIYQLGAEVGYDLGLSPTFVLRPKLGLGYGTGVGEVEFNGSTSESDESGLAITPGVQGLFDLGGLFLSVEGRYNIFNIESESPDGTGGTTTTDFDASGLLLGVGVGATF